MSGLANNSKYTVLCVDDNQNNLFTLNALLADLDDLLCLEALDAQKALEILLKQHVDLILCDVQMPDINGFELAKMIKSNKKTKHIPIVFVTAVFKNEEFIQQGFELGAVDYVTKPIDDNQLLNKITLYLKIFQEQEKLIQSEKKFHDIAQSIGDGMYTIDTNSQVTFINSEALSLLGFEEKELMGENIHHYIHYKDKNNNPIPIEQCKMHSHLSEKNIYKSNDEVLIKKDGSFLSVSIRVTPLYSQNTVIGSIVTFSDNTAKNTVQKLEDEKIETHVQVIHSMIDMIESRDSYTAGHTKRVAYYAELIAIELQHTKEDIELLKKAAWLHDIGKIATPDSILLKPGKLDGVEYKLIQEHLNAGYEMLKKIDHYKEIAEIMREHHERFDGSGYPRGLKADEIQPLSQVLIVADAFDAMTTNRIYKPRKIIEQAFEELESFSAISYHPDVVSAALRALKNVKINLEVSQLPKTSIEEQRFSYFYKDRLTNLFIIEYLETILRYYMKSKKVYIYSIRLENFSSYNKKMSWKKGDIFLVDFANFLVNTDNKNIVFRVEGDDFIILSEKKQEDLEKSILEYVANRTDILSCKVTEEYFENIYLDIDKVIARFIH
ncbi:response regulator [Sulfurimonas sp.]|nr:response regulator [Sulfurimonas sp.]